MATKGRRRERRSTPADANRLRFERADLEATEAVVRIIRIAERLANESPDIFFRMSPSRRDALIAEAAAASGLASAPEAGLLGALLGSLRGTPHEILTALIDLLKAEKEYWRPPPPPPPPPEKPFPPGTPTPPEDPFFPPEPPGTHQCRVARFDVPARRTGPRIEQGNPPPLFNMYEGFAMEADFVSDADGSDCPCCEYRQYVCELLVINGRQRIGYVPDPGNPDDGVVAVMPFPSFVEDGLLPDQRGPNDNVYYGHRDEGDQDASDRYLPDRATGCQYRGTDRPGLYNVRPGTTFTFELTFLGVVIDTCNGNALRAARVWTVRLSNQ